MGKRLLPANRRRLSGSGLRTFLAIANLWSMMGRGGKVFPTGDVGELAWEAHVALRLGLEAVMDWPSGFMREIDSMRDRWDGDKMGSLYRCVGAIGF